MSRFLGQVAYPIAKAAERASVRLGTGDFGILDGYKCVECHRDPSLPECQQCRVAWAREVGNVDYSDAYERRVNITMGTLSLVLATCSWSLNNALDWWEFGPFLASINAVLLQYTPHLSSLSPVARGIYVVVLWCFWGIAVAGILTGYCMSMFLLCMNPHSKRHWKHLTLSAILTLIVTSVVYFVVLLQGVYSLDGLLVVLPAFTGVLALMMVLCMRKPVDGRDESELGKLV